MKMTFVVFAMLWGVSGVGSYSVSVMEGDSVTLHTGVQTNQQDRIKWYYNDIRIAQINRDHCKICADDQCNERFRGRLKLDHQTGSLTITNSTNTDSGEYQLKILSRSSEKIFNVNVTGFLGAETDKRKMVTEGTPPTSDTDPHKTNRVAVITCALLFTLATVAAAFVIRHRHRKSEQKQKTNKSVKDTCHSVSVTEGDLVTLKTGVTRVQRDDQIMWWFESGDTPIAEIKKGNKETHDGGRFRGRLELNDQTGSLTIINTRKTDYGKYTLKIISSGETSLVRYRLTVLYSISRGAASDEHLKPLSTSFDV